MLCLSRCQQEDLPGTRSSLIGLGIHAPASRYSTDSIDVYEIYTLGQMLERADKTTRIIDVKYFMLLPSVEDVGTPVDEIQWSALLYSTSAYEMYRQRFGPIAPIHIIDFLLTDRDFPRSLYYGLYRANLALHAISGTPLESYANKAEQDLGRILSILAFTDVDTILGRGLHEYLDGTQVQLNELGNAIFEAYFAMRPIPQELDLALQMVRK